MDLNLGKWWKKFLIHIQYYYYKRTRMYGNIHRQPGHSFLLEDVQQVATFITSYAENQGVVMWHDGGAQ